MAKIYNWFQERLEIQAIADDISSKYVPPHVNIFYCFGGIVFTCFLVQVATGFAMTFYYRPSVADAFASVEYMMTQVNFGWLIRSIHRWSARSRNSFFGSRSSNGQYSSSKRGSCSSQGFIRGGLRVHRALN